MNQQYMQGMIYGGAFGTSGPMNPPGFYSYQNNIIPFGNYNQMQPQQQYYNNPYGMQQPQNNGIVFQPVGGYQQPTSYSAYVKQQQSDYYHPYGNTFSKNSYGNNFNQNSYGYNSYGNTFNQNPYGYNSYGNSYSYNNYGGYVPYASPVAMQQYQTQQVELFKIKYRLANHYLGNEIDEEYLDKMCNPYNPIHQKTDEQRSIEEDHRFMQYVSKVANGIIQVPKSYIQREAEMLNLMSYNKHQALDRHSLCQFLEEDLWRLQREEWIRQNLKINGNRDLSAVYNSNDFNELLKLHSSSPNSYVGDLLNNSRYDNNLDDIELGINLALDKERRRKAILEGKVPEFISSDEAQKRRHEWTQQLMNQIYRKGSVT